MFRKLQKNVCSRPELIILLLMIMVVVMLIIPLPTYLIDFLIGLNLTIALIIFLSSFYISRAIDFSSFPSILLISTIFRLAISISTSRLVLKDADAGEIIASFGNFVIADNLVVGFVIFFIVTIVQFIVITKGCERIAEVAARFSLDAMPGKQMSIDADLKAGVIDASEVKKRRGELETESQLYGALDGAMKFIKGDAIAGIIIIFVNLLGGISVGVFQHGMDMSHAVSTFSLLTVGDALVAQIPALLISISAGMLVTRVKTPRNMNLGAKILHDMLNNSFILFITALLTVGLGLLPGFPFPVFLVLAGLLGLVYFRTRMTKNDPESDEENVAAEGGSKAEKGTADIIDGEYIPETIPLIISVYEGYKSFFEAKNIASLIKRSFFIEYGVRLPEIIINFSDEIAQGKFHVAINEIQVVAYDIFPDMHKVLFRGEELACIDNSVKRVETALGATYWIPESRAENVKPLGFYTRSAVDELYSCVATLLVRNVSEFFGIQESKNLLDDLEKKYPELLKECFRNNTVQRITEVFQRLLQERISIRNMRLILEALVQWAPKEKDPIMLVEHVRSVLSRYISNRFALDGRISAITLSHELECHIREGVRQTSAGSFINLPPNEVDDLIVTLTGVMKKHGIQPRDVILLVAQDIRRFVKKLIEITYPDCEVLSFGDISSTVNVNILDSINLPGETHEI